MFRIDFQAFQKYGDKSCLMLLKLGACTNGDNLRKNMAIICFPESN